MQLKKKIMVSNNLFETTKKILIVQVLNNVLQKNIKAVKNKPVSN